MKILLLENDTKLITKISEILDYYDIKVVVVNDESKIYKNIKLLDEIKLCILDSNLKEFTINLIKKYNCLMPILVIINTKDYKSIKELLKYIYYHSNPNDILFNNFHILELVYRVLKICPIWNENIIKIDEEYIFDDIKSSIILKNKILTLGKKEKKLLKIFLQNRGNIVTKMNIIIYVYDSQPTSDEAIRSLVKELRKKLPKNAIQTIKSIGYKLKK